MIASSPQLVALGPAWLDPSVLLSGLGPWVPAGACVMVVAECGR